MSYALRITLHRDPAIVELIVGDLTALEADRLEAEYRATYTAQGYTVRCEVVTE